MLKSLITLIRFLLEGIGGVLPILVIFDIAYVVVASFFVFYTMSIAQYSNSVLGI